MKAQKYTLTCVSGNGERTTCESVGESAEHAKAMFESANPNQRVIATELVTAGRRIMRRREVLALIGISEATLWRMEKAGAFPQRVKLSARLVGYLSDQVEGWLRSRQECGAEPDATRTVRRVK